METAEAYRHCKRITWSQARNFAYGIRLLPAEKRQALAAVYAFARRIDDIGDGAMPAADKLAALEEARAVVCGMAHAGVAGADGRAQVADDDPVLVALTDVVKRFAVPVAAFGELIDGCVADVRGTRYQTFDDLLHYCRCVAGSVGRLSLGVFGAADMAAAVPLADSLGVALQLTNILRDIREDYRAGRVYLPAEDLDRFGCTLVPPTDAPDDGLPLDPGAEARLVRLIEFEVARARDWYATGMRLLPMLDRRSAACTGAMAGIYAGLLDRIAANPAAVLRGRLSLAPWQKAMVAVRALGRGPGRTGRAVAVRQVAAGPVAAGAPAQRADAPLPGREPGVPGPEAEGTR